jgi:glucans biosynthesis protein C
VRLALGVHTFLCLIVVTPPAFSPLRGLTVARELHECFPVYVIRLLTFECAILARKMIDQDRPIAPSPRGGQSDSDEDGFLIVEDPPAEASPRPLLEESSIASKFVGSSKSPVLTSGVERNRPPQEANASLALSNLRGAIALVVVAFHASLAYLSSSASTPFPFDQAPYAWRAFPIVDTHRWLGFDLFCAWQDVYLMSLMFFLSALFAWPSCSRKGSVRFLSDRVWRLGLPFLFGVAIVIPIALYPVYRTTAIDPSVTEYGRHFLALPFWPNGPMWFLWELLAFTAIAAILCRFFPTSVVYFSRLSVSANSRPMPAFLLFAAACIVAYVPLAIVFTPWRWADQGPFALQFSRPLLYALFYLSGLAIGAHGLDRGLLSSEGSLARYGRNWALLAFFSLMLWMGLTGWSMSYAPSPAPLTLQFAADVGFALASASSVLFVIGIGLRFGVFRSVVLDRLSKNAMGIYLLHYAPVVWLQYILRDLGAPAFVKVMVVFGGALLVSWLSIEVLRAIPFGARLIGEDARAFRPRAAV